MPAVETTRCKKIGTTTHVSVVKKAKQKLIVWMLFFSLNYYLLNSYSWSHLYHFEFYVSSNILSLLLWRFCVITIVYWKVFQLKSLVLLILILDQVPCSWRNSYSDMSKSAVCLHFQKCKHRSCSCPTPATHLKSYRFCRLEFNLANFFPAVLFLQSLYLDASLWENWERK